MSMPVITASPDASEYWVTMIDRIFRPVPGGLNCDVVFSDGSQRTIRVVGATFQPGHAYGHDGEFPAIEYWEVDENCDPVGGLQYLHEYDFTGLEIC